MCSLTLLFDFFIIIQITPAHVSLQGDVTSMNPAYLLTAAEKVISYRFHLFQIEELKTKKLKRSQTHTNSIIIPSRFLLHP